MQAIIYTRFSPQRNGDKSESCEVQLAYCEQKAAEKGYEIGGSFSDPDVSGEEETRPGLWAAIDRLGRGDVLLVWKYDRLARNVYLSECIRRAVDACGARIEAVEGGIEGDTAEAVMVRQVLAAIAEYERKIIALRTKFAMLHHQQQGRRMSGEPPFGYSFQGDTMLPVVGEQITIAAILDKRGEQWDILRIVRWLNSEEEHQTRSNRPWVRRDVERIIANHPAHRQGTTHVGDSDERSEGTAETENGAGSG
jgi:DNA invertase Pin-like site-specific DNA recombinase